MIKCDMWVFHFIVVMIANVHISLEIFSFHWNDNLAKVDDSLRTNHLLVCCDGGQLTILKAKF